RRSGTAFGDALPLGLVGDLLAQLGQVVWAVGLLARGQECSPLAPQGGAAPQEVTGGTPLRRRDVGWWEQAAAQEGGNLVRIDRGIFGLAALDGFPGEGVAQDKGHTLVPHTRRRASPRCRGTRRRPRAHHARAQGPGGTVQERLAYCGAAALPPP